MAMRERSNVEDGIRRNTSPIGILNPSYGGAVSLELLLDIRELLQGLNKGKGITLAPKKKKRSRR